MPSKSTTHADQPRTRQLWVFYHYLYPDSIVSSILMDQLCQDLQQRGWTVTGFSSNRSSREEDGPYPTGDAHHGVHVRRIWRPPLRQSSSLGRLLNAAWMISAWSLLALDSNPPETILVGTDPILSVLTAIFWKFFSPETLIVHWCFDVYPEAAYADRLLSPTGWIARLLTRVTRLAYRNCDAIIDIGTCMRDRLSLYGSPARVETVVPWALQEPNMVLPPVADERQQIAADAKLALLYSGSFGRAHTCDNFLALAGALRGESAALAFSVRGNREQALRTAAAAMDPEATCPIRFVPFAHSERLLDRLAAPDVHLLSLSPEWEGLVVPSKFFGALAVGRPVLFSGSANSSISRWITQHHLGWVLTSDNVNTIAQDLLRYVNDPQRVTAMQQRCFDIYQAQFSRASGMARVQTLLSDLYDDQSL